MSRLVIMTFPANETLIGYLEDVEYLVSPVPYESPACCILTSYILMMALTPRQPRISQANLICRHGHFPGTNLIMINYDQFVLTLHVQQEGQCDLSEAHPRGQTTAAEALFLVAATCC